MGKETETHFTTTSFQELTNTEYRGMITSLVLLATLFLIQARMLLALLATWTHKIFIYLKHRSFFTY